MITVSFGAKGLIKRVFHLSSCTLSLTTLSLLETFMNSSFGITFGTVTVFLTSSVSWKLQPFTLVLITERAKNHWVPHLVNKGHVPVKPPMFLSYTAWQRLLSELELCHDVGTLCWAEVQTVYYAQPHITTSIFLCSKPCRLYDLVWTNKILYFLSSLLDTCAFGWLLLPLLSMLSQPSPTSLCHSKSASFTASDKIIWWSTPTHTSVNRWLCKTCGFSKMRSVKHSFNLKIVKKNY